MTSEVPDIEELKSPDLADADDEEASLSSSVWDMARMDGTAYLPSADEDTAQRESTVTVAEPTVGDAPSPKLEKGTGSDNNGDSGTNESSDGEENPVYTVKGGDHLWAIARKHLGEGAKDADVKKTVNEIIRLNDLKKPGSLKEGQKLRLPKEAGDKAQEVSKGDDKLDPKEKLLKVAESVIKDRHELAQFKRDLATFEKNGAKLEDLFKKQGRDNPEQLAKAEVEKTLNHITRLLEARDNKDVPLNQRNRVQIAEQLIGHLADPTTIDQGFHNTCNVTSLESRLATRNPAEVAELVVDVATTGKYKTEDGSVIQPTKRSLEPHDESRTHPRVDGKRTLASQIFTVTAINIHYARKHPHIRYEQVEPVADATPPDTGERLIDYTQKPPRLMTSEEIAKMDGDKPGTKNSNTSPNLSISELIDISNQIAQEGSGKWYFQHEMFGSKGPTEVKTMEELEQKLTEARDKGMFPVTIMLHTGHEPFVTDSGGGMAGGSGGYHVVNIVGFKDGKVEIDNQWGRKSDHLGKDGISLADIFLAMRKPTDSSNLTALENLLKENRKAGVHDHIKEFDLVRFKNDAGCMQTDELFNDLCRCVRESGDTWKAQPSIDGKEYSRVWKRSSSLVKHLPFDRRLEVMQLERQCGFLNDTKFYDSYLTNCYLDMLKFNHASPQVIEARRAELKRAQERFGQILGKLPKDRVDKIRADIARGYAEQQANREKNEK